LEPVIESTAAPVIAPLGRISGAVAALWNSQRGLAGVAAWSFLAAVIARGSNLAAMIICARTLAQEQFGQIAIIQSTVGTFAPIAGLGLAITTTKFIAEFRDTNPVRAGRVLALSLTAATLAGLAMTAALILSAPLVAVRAFDSPPLAAQLIQASGLLALGVIESVQTGALTGLEAFSRIARMSMWSGLLSIPILGVLVLTRGVSGAIAGLTISLLLSCVFNAIALRAECRKWGIRPTLAGSASETQILLHFSLPSYLSGILVAPVTWLNSALLVHRPGGLAEMALFTAADRFRYLLIFLPLAVSRIAVPALSRSRSTGDRQGYRDAFQWNIGFGLVATVPPALFCLALSVPLMGLFGESFKRGWLILGILAFSSIPTVMNTQLGAALLSSGRAWARTAIDALLATVFLFSAWLLIPRWNAAGLAFAFALAYTAACAALVISLRRSRE
jgi:O-antigen/teichoic acid export membrane protein